MHIFNNGKYKSILAAQPGELAQIKRAVDSDQDFRPSYHLAPPTGLLNDPNGLIFDGEKYHIFYQWFPFDALHGMKHWQHVTTTDFIQYQKKAPLIPTELFESHGCYSGGALPLEGDKFAVFYTGNTRRLSDNQRIPYQNLAIFSKTGELITKRALIDQAPAGYTEHVRDPKPFYTQEGRIRFVCGAQRQNLTGTALLFEMENLDSEPKLLGELQLPAFDNDQVFMWECPDLFKLGNKDVFIWSPQGKSQGKYQYQNNYHAVYAVGKLEGLTFNLEHMAELDQGFDFYAPQTFAGLTNQSQTMMYGWVGLPDLTYPTDKFKWHSLLTMPRAISLQGNKLIQRPVESIYQNLTAFSSLSLTEPQEIDKLDQAYVRIELNNQDFQLTLFDNPKQQGLVLSYQQGVLTLDRSQSEQTELMAQFGQVRHCKLEKLHQLELFFDRSVLEIFINGGEQVMTSRFFIAERTNRIASSQPLTLQIAYPATITYLEEAC